MYKDIHGKYHIDGFILGVIIINTILILGLIFLGVKLI